MIYEMDRFENMKKVNTWNIVLVFAVVVLVVTVALLARHSAASSGDAVMKCILTRTSIRAYQDRPVEDEKVEQLLRAAMAAPTAGNKQPWRFVVIEDRQTLKEISAHFQTMKMAEHAPLVLVFCADCRKWYDAYKEAGCTPRTPGVGDLMLAVTDTAIAAQNAVVAAESFGIGSCYIGDIMENCDTQRSLLHLPDYVFPAVMLVFGWPTQQQKDRVKPQRCAMEHIVHENGYRTMDGAELRDTFGYKAGNTPFDQWCTAFCNRKYNSDFSKEMTRSAEEYLNQFR